MKKADDPSTSNASTEQANPRLSATARRNSSVDAVGAARDTADSLGQFPGGEGLSNTAPAGVVAFILAALFAATATFKEDTGLFQEEITREHLIDYLLLVLAVLAVTVLVFWLVVGRAVRSRRASAVGLVLGVLGILAVVVFWSGLPAIFGVGGAYLGMAGLRAGSPRAVPTVAIIVAAVAVLVGAWAAVTL